MTDDPPKPEIQSYRWYEDDTGEEVPAEDLVLDLLAENARLRAPQMTDDVVERVARLILEEIEGCPWEEFAEHEQEPYLRLAQTVLAAFRPHEQVQEFLWTTDANPWALEAQIAREAREEMRERCAVRLEEIFAELNEKNDTLSQQALIEEIRALPVEGE